MWFSRAKVASGGNQRCFYCWNHCHTLSSGHKCQYILMVRLWIQTSWFGIQTLAFTSYTNLSKLPKLLDSTWEYQHLCQGYNWWFEFCNFLKSQGHTIFYVALREREMTLSLTHRYLLFSWVTKQHCLCPESHKLCQGIN